MSTNSGTSTSEQQQQQQQDLVSSQEQTRFRFYNRHISTTSTAEAVLTTEKEEEREEEEDEEREDDKQMADSSLQSNSSHSRRFHFYNAAEVAAEVASVRSVLSAPSQLETTTSSASSCAVAVQQPRQQQMTKTKVANENNHTATNSSSSSSNTTTMPFIPPRYPTSSAASSHVSSILPPSSTAAVVSSTIANSQDILKNLQETERQRRQQLTVSSNNTNHHQDASASTTTTATTVKHGNTIATRKKNTSTTTANTIVSGLTANSSITTNSSITNNNDADNPYQAAIQDALRFLKQQRHEKVSETTTIRTTRSVDDDPWHNQRRPRRQQRRHTTTNNNSNNDSAGQEQQTWIVAPMHDSHTSDYDDDNHNKQHDNNGNDNDDQPAQEHYEIIQSDLDHYHHYQNGARKQQKHDGGNNSSEQKIQGDDNDDEHASLASAASMQEKVQKGVEQVLLAILQKAQSGDGDIVTQALQSLTANNHLSIENLGDNRVEKEEGAAGLSTMQQEINQTSSSFSYHHDSYIPPSRRTAKEHWTDDDDDDDSDPSVENDNQDLAVQKHHHSAPTKLQQHSLDQEGQELELDDTHGIDDDDDDDEDDTTSHVYKKSVVEELLAESQDEQDEQHHRASLDEERRQEKSHHNQQILDMSSSRDGESGGGGGGDDMSLLSRVLGPLGGAATGVVLEVTANNDDDDGGSSKERKLHRPLLSSGTTGSLMETLVKDAESLVSYMSNAMGGGSEGLSLSPRSPKKKQDRYATEVEEADVDDDNSMDVEANELMRSLCAHLLPYGVDKSTKHLSEIPPWDETQANEPGYRIIRLHKTQLLRVEQEFQRMVQSLQQSSFHDKKKHDHDDDDVEEEGIETFEKDLREAEDLLEQEEERQRQEREKNQQQISHDIIQTPESVTSSKSKHFGSYPHGRRRLEQSSDEEDDTTDDDDDDEETRDNDEDTTDDDDDDDDEEEEEEEEDDDDDEYSADDVVEADDDAEVERAPHPDFPGVKASGCGEMGDLEYFSLPIIHKSNVTGFEPTKDMILEPGNVVAGQYLVESELGSAAFSTAYRCVDLNTDTGGEYHDEVCLKVIKNTKDFFDQSLDEIKILELLRRTGQCDENNIVEMRTFFYHREHLIIVTELLRQNLFEFGKFILDNDEERYFTRRRLCYISRQVLIALKFVHSLKLIHSDVKPENILLASYSRAKVKLIDFGSSCYLTDRQSSYIQSRSYRAPEVILGLPYDGKIDIWSLGCVVAEMYTGEVTFQNDSIVSMLSRIEAICGPFPRHMIAQGRQSNRFFTKSGLLYELVEERDGDNDDRHGNNNDGGGGGGNSRDRSNPLLDDDESGLFDIFQPKRTTLAARLGVDPTVVRHSTTTTPSPDDPTLFVDFCRCLLRIDPDSRPSAKEALEHPWIVAGESLTEEDIKYPSG